MKFGINVNVDFADGVCRVYFLLRDAAMIARSWGS